MQNYYQLLNINFKADSETIKQAYRKLCKVYHPDLNQNKKEAEEKFKQVQKAYEVLSNPKEKINYDQKLQKTKENKQTQEEFIKRRQAQKVAQEKYEAFLRDLAKKRQTETRKQQQAYEKALKQQAELKRQKELREQAELKRLRETKLREKQEKRLTEKLQQDILERKQVQLEKQRQKEKQEIQAWTQAIIEHTIEAYQYFMLNFPNGKYLPEAQIRLHQLYQEQNYFEINEGKDNFDVVYEMCEEGHLYENTLETCPYCEEAEHEITDFDLYNLRFWTEIEEEKIELIAKEEDEIEDKNIPIKSSKKEATTVSLGIKFLLFWFLLVFLLWFFKDFWNS